MSSSVRLPEDLLAALGGALPEAGEWYPMHQLLTAGPDGGPAVCLLSRAEVRATPQTVSVAARSSRAAANLAVTGTATLVAWTAAKPHYVALTLRDTVAAREGVHGYSFGVGGVRIDDIGIEMRPPEYRMEAWLAAAERWETTSAILDELADRAASALPPRHPALTASSIRACPLPRFTCAVP